MGQSNLCDIRDRAIEGTNPLPIGTSDKKILIDESVTDKTYIGKAKIGASESVAIWQIMLIDSTGSVDKINLFPDGDTSERFVWDDRLSLTYN